MSLRRSSSNLLAFIGTATLVAGTVAGIPAGCLTDPDKCTILLSRNTVGGTLGFLTAPLTGRGAAATTFTITSTSATETSTVNWMVIPKNIGNALSTSFVNNASMRRGPAGRFVRHGTATLAGGTVTVTGVPFGPGALVFVMANTFAGTSGKLSVPDATVLSTAGTFIINSNQGADTSTVDWVCIDGNVRFSPSGRLFAQSKGDLGGPTNFTNMNPLDGPFLSVLASVITPSTPGNLSAPQASRTGGAIGITPVGGDISTVEVAAF